MDANLSDESPPGSLGSHPLLSQILARSIPTRSSTFRRETPQQTSLGESSSSSSPWARRPWQGAAATPPPHRPCTLTGLVPRAWTALPTTDSRSLALASPFGPACFRDSGTTVLRRLRAPKGCSLNFCFYVGVPAWHLENPPYLLGTWDRGHTQQVLTK